MPSESEIQRGYYSETAMSYDGTHTSRPEGASLDVHLLSSLIGFYGATSVLDVGAGTGRSIRFLQSRHGNLKVLGIEPVRELRQVGYEKGVQENDLVEGNALSLAYVDDMFDIVCEFGILHHIRDHERAVREMTRVARLGVFISDGNNFGQGSPIVRGLKQALHLARLWPAVDYIRTRGKGYMISKGDGLFYSYSVFDSVPIIREKFPDITYMNGVSSGPNLYRTAAQVVIFAHK